ncbi:ATP-binding protein [Nocardia sp. NPDC052566]|uniref:ATP-binding protein n=1 Tax=Nocardia sp. NPDC052566 TaxID=3364330 RepID=UPI0037C8AAE2
MSHQKHSGAPDPDRFVGRERELRRIGELLQRPARLLTLVGPGGIGKTRLAAEAARGYRNATKRPVHWVRLARMTAGAGATAVVDEVAQQVVGNDFSNRSAWDAVVQTLSTNSGVLVLDNCEHVQYGVGSLVDHLLDAVADLTVVATSRKAIGWVDEQRISVPPLTHADAIALFEQRAELTGRRLARDDDAIISAICRRMDDHPLFVRLAAARLTRSTPAMILSELGAAGGVDQRLDWTDGPRYGVEPRHRALADVVAWSYDLCTPEERLLLERLSIFAAGYTVDSDSGGDRFGADIGVDVEAIEAVCSDDETTAAVHLTPDRIRGALDDLVDQSMVVVHFDRPTVRYSLVESVRVFAERRLQERSTAAVDEPARVARKYLYYYRDKITEMAETWNRDRSADIPYWAVDSWDNLRAATELGISTPDEATAGLQICAAILALRLPFTLGSFREARRLTERALHAAVTSTPALTELRITTMAVLAIVAQIQGDREGLTRLLEQCVDHYLAGLPESARPQNWRDTTDSDIGLPAVVEIAWGHELVIQRDPRAVTVLERGAAKCALLGDQLGAQYWDLSAGLWAALLWPQHPSRERAAQWTRTAPHQSSWVTVWGQLKGAVALSKGGEPEAALEVQRTALVTLLKLPDVAAAIFATHSMTWSLAELITVLQGAEHPDRNRITALAVENAQLLGATAKWRATLHLVYTATTMGPFYDETERAITLAREILGDNRYTEAESQGAQLRPEHHEVELFAAGMLSLAPRRQAQFRGESALWHLLTQAERDVATLAAGGLTNIDIAVRRGTSRKTVDAQLAAILQKLSISSRAHIKDHLLEDDATRTSSKPAVEPRRGSSGTGT